MSRLITIGLKDVVEWNFTATELFNLAHCRGDPMLAVSEWTNPIMYSLEKTHSEDLRNILRKKTIELTDFERVVFDYIKENYKGG
jgi:hypothetical protein